MLIMNTFSIYKEKSREKRVDFRLALSILFKKVLYLKKICRILRFELLLLMI
jgi:hypothetical protein